MNLSAEPDRCCADLLESNDLERHELFKSSKVDRGHMIHAEEVVKADIGNESAGARDQRDRYQISSGLAGPEQVRYYGLSFQRQTVYKAEVHCPCFCCRQEELLQGQVETFKVQVAAHVHANQATAADPWPFSAESMR